MDTDTEKAVELYKFNPCLSVLIRGWKKQAARNSGEFRRCGRRWWQS
jgi:hypothetical protein